MHYWDPVLLNISVGAIYLSTVVMPIKGMPDKEAGLQVEEDQVVGLSLQVKPKWS